MTGMRVQDGPLGLIDGRTALPVWHEVLLPYKRGRGDGKMAAPVAEFIEQVRLLATMHVEQQRSRSGPPRWTDADRRPRSQGDSITTRDLAERLDVGHPRSARRIAARYGVEPLRDNCWRLADVDRLAELYHRSA